MVDGWPRTPRGPVRMVDVWPALAATRRCSRARAMAAASLGAFATCGNLGGGGGAGGVGELMHMGLSIRLRLR